MLDSTISYIVKGPTNTETSDIKKIRLIDTVCSSEGIVK